MVRECGDGKQDDFEAVKLQLRSEAKLAGGLCIDRLGEA
jgi:hypothetical protein